jgi:hypothetical protein
MYVALLLSSGDGLSLYWQINISLFFYLTLIATVGGAGIAQWYGAKLRAE